MFSLTRVCPPLTITGKPITATFLYTTEKATKASSNPEKESIYACCYRNQNGDTKTELYVGGARQKPSAAILWRVESHERLILSFDTRQAMKGTNPVYPSETSWLPNGEWTLQMSGKQKVIQDIICNYVTLKPKSDSLDQSIMDECLVSYEWGIVVLDKVTYIDNSRCWELEQIRYSEPTAFLDLNIPDDFIVH